MAEGSPARGDGASNANGASEAVAAFVRIACALKPAIEAAAADTEHNAALSPAVLGALHEAGMFRLLLPRSIGGHEVEPAVFIEVLEALAGADASTAWVVAQGCGCSLSAAYLAPEVARELFGAGNAALAWGPSGTGARAVAVDGGFRVTGRWHFASGNRHAQWLGGHCMVHEADGQPRLDGVGRPVDRTVIFPRRSARVDGVWQVIGLKGTGSDSYAVEDLFVPASHSYRREAKEERREHGPLYDFTGLSMFAFGIAAIGLGIARTMLDALIRHASDKTERTTGRALRDSGVIQAEIAKAEAKLLSARGFMLAMARDLYATAVSGQAFTAGQRARMRLSTTWAASQAREVADLAYTAAGATAIFAAEPFERRFRDMHTLTQQVQAHASNFELVGQSLLGVQGASRSL